MNRGDQAASYPTPVFADIPVDEAVDRFLTWLSRGDDRDGVLSESDLSYLQGVTVNGKECLGNGCFRWQCIDYDNDETD